MAERLQFDYVIVSDLHLGAGRSETSARYFHLENFFFDQEFLLFTRFLTRKARGSERPLKLIINGDFMDLLRIDRIDDLHREKFRLKTAKRKTSRLDYESVVEELEAKVSVILRGHPVFFQALGEFLMSGQYVLIMPGNHDHEIQLETLRAGIRRAIAAHIDTDDEVLSRLEFRSWFYHEPGLLWVEHGNQYDAYNSFRYPLKRELPEPECTCYEDEIDMPFGSYFQRYLYNRFGKVTFIVPGRQSNAQYFLWLLVNRPSIIFKSAFGYGPLFFKMARRCLQGHEAWEREAERRHREDMDRLARESGLGEKLARIEALKTVGGRAALIVERIFKRTVIGIAAFLGGLSLFLWIWFMAYSAIWSQVLPGWTRPFLFVFMNLFLLLAVFGGVTLALYRTMKKPAPTPYRTAAAAIARLTGVKIVTFGHSHREDSWRVPGTDAWYFNTGTWIATFTAFRIEPRESVQFTYLQILDGKAALMVWSPEVERPKPAVLLDED